jgi:hypothetical protein
MAESNLTITKVEDPRTGGFEEASLHVQLAKRSGLISSFRAAWVLVEQDGTHSIRVFLCTLRHAKTVCEHLNEELDQLIAVVEAKLAERESVDTGVRNWERALRSVGYK